MTAPFDVVEATIPELCRALQDGRTTSEELVASYSARIEAYDRSGPMLNSVVVTNPQATQEARESDARRARGEVLSPLDGIPYTAKDSYTAQGLTVAAGPPAFATLMAPRQSVLELFQATRNELEDAGAVTTTTDLPVVTNYEGDRAGAPTISTRGLVSPDYLTYETRELSA